MIMNIVYEQFVNPDGQNFSERLYDPEHCYCYDPFGTTAKYWPCGGSPLKSKSLVIFLKVW